MSTLLVEFEYLQKDIKETNEHGEQVVVEILEIALLSEASENKFGKSVDLDLVLELRFILVLLEVHIGLAETLLQHFE